MATWERAADRLFAEVDLTETQKRIRTDADYQMSRAGVPDEVRQSARAVHDAVEAVRRSAEGCTRKQRNEIGDALARSVERELQR